MLAIIIKDKQLSNISDDIYFELRERARFHLEIENRLNRLKVELIEILYQTFPGIESLFKNSVKKFPHPNLLKRLSINELSQKILNSTDKRIFINKAETYALKLLNLADNSYSSVNLSSFLVEKAIYVSEKLLDSIEKLRIFDEAMIKRAKNLPRLKCTQSSRQVNN